MSMGIPGIGRAPSVWVSHTEPAEPTDLGIPQSGRAHNIEDPEVERPAASSTT